MHWFSQKSKYVINLILDCLQFCWINVTIDDLLIIFIRDINLMGTTTTLPSSFGVDSEQRTGIFARCKYYTGRSFLCCFEIFRICQVLDKSDKVICMDTHSKAKRNIAVQFYQSFKRNKTITNTVINLLSRTMLVIVQHKMQTLVYYCFII